MKIILVYSKFTIIWTWVSRIINNFTWNVLKGVTTHLIDVVDVVCVGVLVKGEHAVAVARLHLDAPSSSLHTPCPTTELPQVIPVPRVHCDCEVQVWIAWVFSSWVLLGLVPWTPAAWVRRLGSEASMEVAAVPVVIPRVLVGIKAGGGFWMLVIMQRGCNAAACWGRRWGMAVLVLVVKTIVAVIVRVLIVNRFSLLNNWWGLWWWNSWVFFSFLVIRCSLGPIGRG